MQIFILRRRLAALLPLALACLATPGLSAAAQTQTANVVPIIALTAPGEDFENPPRGVRSDMLLASDGNIYFGSYAGGNGAGAIARLTPDGVLSTLHALEGNGSQGVTIYGPLMQASDGHLYGTAYFGGEEGGGTLFRVMLDGTFEVLHEFGGGEPNAIFPYTGVTEGPDGQLYGTTFRGGTFDAGVVFRIAIDGSGYTVLHHFTAGNGENPEGTLLAAPDGMLYGTTMMGGANNRGTIYRISTTGAHEVLYSFPSLTRFNTQGLATNATGANPRAGLMLGLDGNFYGTAFQGGEFGHGSVYRMTPAGEVSVLHSFRGPSFGGANPLATVTQDAAGNFYGTTQRGGYLHRGAAWRLSPDGETFTLLHSFSGSPTDGQAPWTTLLHAHDRLYAVSFSDNLGDAGAIVELDEGSGGLLPLSLSVSQSEFTYGSDVSIDWNAPAGATCQKIGGTLGWTGETTVSGSQTFTPLPGAYAFGLSCTDADDGDESTPLVLRIAYVGLVVHAPALQPVDGGGGAGALSLWWLLAIAALLYSRNLKEKRSSCP